MVAVLFVCTGNICRSPTAEAVFRDALKKRGLTGRFTHDSAGVDSYHVGQAPDRRSQATARAKGVEMGDLRARNMRREDFTEFDLILAMDESHLKALQRMAPMNGTAAIALYLPHSGHPLQEVPDPYYGEQDGFDAVYRMIEEATEGLLNHLTGVAPRPV